MKKYTLVIPSVGNLSAEMEAETGCRYGAFIPLGGVPLYLHILSLYKPFVNIIRFVIVVSEEAPDLELDQLEQGYQVEIIRLRSSASIGESVLAGLSQLNDQDAVIVHMADTLIDTEAVLGGNKVYVNNRNDLYRWTSVAKRQDGSISVISDRDQVESLESQLVCVGLFSFFEGKEFLNYLKLSLGFKNGNEPFFSALENFSKRYKVELYEAERWFDCGHVDTYYETRLSYQNLRHFNTLTYEPKRAQITKTSTNTEAFRHQVRWFKQVPDELDAFLPRIFSSSDGEVPFITMELLSIPTLGELFTFQRLNIGAWNGVVQTIAHIQSRFESMSTPSSLAPQLAHSIYLDKTRSRLKEFSIQRPEAANYRIFHDGTYWSLDIVKETLDYYVQQTGLLKVDKLAPIHGDFCFSNLLYDPKVRLVKMIDPRGEFGVPGIFGDRRYDLAKLAHSYSGGYDFIVADRFKLDLVQDTNLRVELRTSEYHTRVRAIFDKIILSDLELRLQVDALQALLFLSMLPLHKDRPRRQLAMLTIGLTGYARVWQQCGGKL